MGSEHYVSHAGIGIGGFIYIMFYCSILLLNHTKLMRWEASALCEGGLWKRQKIFRLCSFSNNRTIPKKIPQTLAGLGLENVLGLGTLRNNRGVLQNNGCLTSRIYFVMLETSINQKATQAKG